MASKNRLEYIRALTGPQLVYLNSLVPRWPTLEIGSGLVLQEEAPNQKNVLSVNACEVYLCVSVQGPRVNYSYARRNGNTSIKFVWTPFGTTQEETKFEVTLWMD